VGAAPITVAQTRRVLLARQLIHQTNLSMNQVALASGFENRCAFSRLFRQRFGMTAGALRRQQDAPLLRQSA